MLVKYPCTQGGWQVHQGTALVETQGRGASMQGPRHAEGVCAEDLWCCGEPSGAPWSSSPRVSGSVTLQGPDLEKQHRLVGGDPEVGVDNFR